MIICTKRRTLLRGSILNITSCLMNITFAVYRYLCRHVGEEKAPAVILLCAKAAISEDKSYEAEIIEALSK